MRQEVLGGVVCRHLAGIDVNVDLVHARLPALGPGPRLVGWDRHMRMKLAHAVVALAYLDLSPRLIEVVPTADIGRKGERPAALEG